MKEFWFAIAQAWFSFGNGIGTMTTFGTPCGGKICCPRNTAACCHRVRERNGAKNVLELFEQCWTKFTQFSHLSCSKGNTSWNPHSEDWGWHHWLSQDKMMFGTHHSRLAKVQPDTVSMNFISGVFFSFCFIFSHYLSLPALCVSILSQPFWYLSSNCLSCRYQFLGVPWIGRVCPCVMTGPRYP